MQDLVSLFNDNRRNSFKALYPKDAESVECKYISIPWSGLTSKHNGCRVVQFEDHDEEYSVPMDIRLQICEEFHEEL